MSRKFIPVFVLLIILAMVMAACGGQKAATPAASSGDSGVAQEPVIQTVEVVKTVVVTVEVPAAGAEQPAAPPAPTGYGAIVQRIKDRGKLICGGAPIWQVLAY